MSPDRQADFRYAVSNTELIVTPEGMLETFGNTMVSYVHVCETMDDIERCRIRTGCMKLLRPQIVTPSAYSEMILDGFGEEARKYAEWLRDHEDALRILRYGYTLRRETTSEETVTRRIDDVVADAKKDVEACKDPYLALVKGVDDPWDVCLVRLFWEIVSRSTRHNMEEMSKRHLFDRQASGLTADDMREIEEAFAAARRDRSLVQRLGSLLKRKNAFAVYEERFFALMKGE